MPGVTVLGQESDPRNQWVNDAIDFWNNQLAEIGSGFRFGPVRFVSVSLSPNELMTLSQARWARSTGGATLRLGGDRGRFDYRLV
jgi:hypothetical protein